MLLVVGDLGVKRRLVVVVVREGGMDLGKRQVGMLEVDLFRAPPVRQAI